MVGHIKDVRFARRLAGEGAVTRHRDGPNQRGVYGRRRIVRCRKRMVRVENRVLVSDSQSRHRRWCSLCAASTVCAPPDPVRWTCAGGSQFVTTWSKMNLFRRGKRRAGQAQVHTGRSPPRLCTQTQYKADQHHRRSG